MGSSIIKHILVTSVLFIAIDFVYLNSLKPMTERMIYNIQGSKMIFHYGGAIFAYFCIIALFNYFIIHKNGTIMDAFLLGLLTYGIFEGTNRAIFSKWTIQFMTIDTLWGGILFATVLYLFRILIKALP